MDAFGTYMKIAKNRDLQNPDKTFGYPSWKQIGKGTTEILLSSGKWAGKYW
ncbi:hypothetical protein HVE01_02080 [Vreelandella venusta]|nr:hypothetical protein HVE01_02080 [Halomonas venusta]